MPLLLDWQGSYSGDRQRIWTVGKAKKYRLRGSVADLRSRHTRILVCVSDMQRYSEALSIHGYMWFGRNGRVVECMERQRNACFNRLDSIAHARWFITSSVRAHVSVPNIVRHC